MKKSAWVAAIGLSLVLITGALSGCSSKEAASGDKVLYVGTQNDYPPFAFTNDKNELTGYDVEVVKEIDKSWTAIRLNLYLRAGMRYSLR